MNDKSVLIVEDDLRIANILAKTIDKMAQFSVIGIASSATEAIDVIDCFGPDLIFLDISLEDSCGLDVVKHIRQSFDDNAPNIVMLTAAKDVEIIQKSISSGVFDYILKPIAFTRLNETLHRFLEFSNKLESNTAFEQADVDLFFGKQKKQQNKEAISEIKQTHPKGIDTLTLDKIISVLEANPTTLYTAGAVSECIGTSRTTARRYLEYLLSKDDVRADIEYGTVGRPERRYIIQNS